MSDPDAAKKSEASGATSRERVKAMAQEAGQHTKAGWNATRASFLRVFRIWASLAANPVGRAPDAVNRIAASEAWQSLGWVALLYALVLPRAEYRMLPLILRGGQGWVACTFHAVALCVALTAAVFGAAQLAGARVSIEKAAFTVSIALLPQWIAVAFSALLADWTHGWVFGLIGFGSCVALFIQYAVFTRGFGLGDARATLAVPLAMGLGGGVAYYLSRIAT